MTTQQTLNQIYASALHIGFDHSKGRAFLQTQSPLVIFAYGAHVTHLRFMSSYFVMILEAGQPNMEAIHASMSYILLFQKPISFSSLLLEVAIHIFIGELFPSRK